MIRALLHAMYVLQRHGMSSLTVTSALDGVHKTGSLHYQGLAIDIRSRTLPDELTIANELRDDLGPDYDVLLERDHIHIEYDPR